MVRESRSDRPTLAFGLAFVLAASGGAGAQVTPLKAVSGASPSPPDAVVAPPSWLPPGASFDVAKFLAVPPDARNAAPLYYEAMFELCGEPKACFLDDEPHRRRAKEGAERAKRIGSLYEAQAQGRASTSEVDALLAECGPGLKKLAEAQKRDRCVFPGGLGIAAFQDHATAARHVTRLLSLKSARDLARGKTNDAIDDLAVVMRLSRDLRPRGALIVQLVAGSIESIAAREIAVPILSARGLRGDAVDRLLKVLAEHEAAEIDPWAEAARSETLSDLATIRSLTSDFEAFKAQMGVVPGSEPANVLIGLSAGSADRTADEALNARLKGWKPADDAAVAGILYARCKAMLDPGSTSYSARLKLAKAPVDLKGADDPGLRRLLELLRPPSDGLLISDARCTAESRAVLCLAALRRWKSTKNVAPKDLEAVAKAAGLRATPLDPFDGRPMRMATVGGRLVVYSIGKDLKDDGGRADSTRDTKPGDLVFTLDSPAAR